MILRLTTAEYEKLRDEPSPLLDNKERSKEGLVAFGEPAVELDEEGQPTGYVLMAHPGLSSTDEEEAKTNAKAKASARVLLWEARAEAAAKNEKVSLRLEAETRLGLVEKEELRNDKLLARLQRG